MSASPRSEPGTGAPEASRRARTALSIAFGLTAVGVAVAFLALPERSAPPVLDVSLANWRPSAPAVAAQVERDRALLAKLVLGPAESEVEAALERFNAVEHDVAGEATAPPLRAAQSELTGVLQRYLIDHGMERFHALGLHFRARFTAALTDVLGRAREGRERVLLYPQRHPLAPETRALRARCGAFLVHAVEAGLVAEDGRIAEGADDVPGLFFLVRWFSWIHPVTDYSFQLSETELTTFWGWKAEASRNLPLVRRFELVAQLQRLRPDYPADYVRGVLFAREGRWPDAERHWRAWLVSHPDDARAAENLRFAESMLSNALPTHRP